MADPLFKEMQRPRQWWIKLIILIVAVPAWYLFITAILIGDGDAASLGSKTGIWIYFIAAGLLLPAFLLSVKMTTVVSGDGLTVNYFPVYRRRIKKEEIAAFYVRDYRPVLEYGGWGIRWSIRRGTAYTVQGNRGVQFELSRGWKILIGSQRPEALAEAIEKIKTNPSGARTG